jgi:two-component system sensor histidine kinase TctE
MSLLPLRSVQARVVALIAAVLVAGAALLAGAAWVYARVAADEAYDKLLVGAALQIAETIAVNGEAVTVEPPVSAFRILAMAPNDRIFYRVTGPRGRFLTGYPDLEGPAGEAAGAGPVLADGRYLGSPVRIVTVGRYLPDPSSHGWATVTVAQTTEARGALALTLTARALLLVLAMSALALAAVLLAVRLAFRPLLRVEAAIAGRRPDDLSPLGVAAPPEIEALVRAIDRFMGQLAVRIRFMQRFIADAAHQIRTPLTALASQVDLLSAEPEEDERRRHLARVQARTEELGRLANQLLNHAMVVHRGATTPTTPVDLAAIARRCLAEVAALPLDRTIDIALDAPEGPVLVQGDPVAIREALANLVHNAVRHGARSRLAVAILAGSEDTVVEVADDGPGILRERWDEVREPFHSRTDGRPGAGLGLAIAADAMRAHGGELLFRDQETAGFAVVLRFPRRHPA